MRFGLSLVTGIPLPWTKCPVYLRLATTLPCASAGAPLDLVDILDCRFPLAGVAFVPLHSGRAMDEAGVGQRNRRCALKSL